jgi:mannose-6-phosphate isomerase-like protein (cupin superfamily)
MCEAFMKIFINEKNVTPVRYKDYSFKEMLGEKNGCLAGCRTGVLIYTQEGYRQSGVHDDQEGFFVLSGSGSAMVGDKEFSLEPGVCFIVLPGTNHSIKKDTSCSCIKLFFFHAAV